MNKIRKGDNVVILVGKDKGKRGVVLSNLNDGAVLVEGVNKVKRHTKPNPMKGQVGGVIEKEMPLDISNVALFNSTTGKADRVGFKTLDDGRKVRIYRATGEVVDA
jgi:large subunit ribosomal protein L24